ncbi:hypothetical protein [Solidesulfovibrio alcoholivorans]|uniref:hypothetical protein n=1 Tax=Solidesulfovibrio alcoholivorans TaxID=81406 RepID=UPI0012EBD67F|nr:hypothetical protein [Solidesulfovibrio alcoholivorans]
MEPTIVASLITLFVALLIFLVCRGIVCWYFKINEHIDDQYQQTQVLKKILSILESQQKERAADKNEAKLGRRIYCNACGEDITHMPNVCPNCGKELKYKANSES